MQAVTDLERMATLLHTMACIHPCACIHMQAVTDLERMATLLHTPIEISDAPGAVDLVPIVRAAPAERRDVRFDSVDFRYAVDGAGVHALNLRIPPGGSVALVGPSC